MLCFKNTAERAEIVKIELPLNLLPPQRATFVLEKVNLNFCALDLLSCIERHIEIIPHSQKAAVFCA